MEVLSKLILNLILYFVIAIGENSDRMRNEAVVLSSVYDAMRNNYYVEEASGAAADSNRAANSLFNYELRNKRNINERWDIDKGHQATRDEQVYLAPQQPQYLKAEAYRNPDMDTGEDSGTSGNELICSVYKPGHDERYMGPQNPFLDHNNWKFFSTVGFFMGKAVKFVLSGIALVSLPVIFLVGVGIPLKILLSLKAMTLTNSVVFGSLIYRLLSRVLRPPRFPFQPPITPAPVDDVDDNDNNNNNNNNGNRLQFLNKIGSSLEVDTDYEEATNEEKLQKIIESLKHKNKDW